MSRKKSPEHGLPRGPVTVTSDPDKEFPVVRREPYAWNILSPWPDSKKIP